MVLLKMNEVKKLAFILFILPVTLFSVENNLSQSISVASAYYFPDNKGLNLSGDIVPISYSPIYATNDNERDLGSTWGGLELQGTYKLSGAINNNIKYTFKSGLSPVSFEVGGDITLTPVPFLDFTLGSTIASGWTAIGIVGLGLNDETGIIEDSFQGVLSQTWFTGTFKFDTAAVLSGDTTWKHIILLSSHKFTYKNFSAAGEDDPWSFQGSEGDNYNGVVYSSTSVLAYQMPILLEMAGLLVETETNILSNSERSTMEDGGWGSDFLQVRFGGLFNIKFNENHSLAILPQFITRPHYTDETVKESYFANRKIDTDNPIYYDFDRIAINYTYKF